MALTIFGGHCRLSHDSIVDPVLSSDSGDSDDDDDDDAWTGIHLLSFFIFSSFVSHVMFCFKM